MKKIYLLTSLAACLMLTACEKWPVVRHSLELKWTDCASTKATDTKGESDVPETLLIMEHTRDGLALSLVNAQMNCAIATDGLTQRYSIEGNVIRYDLIQSHRANCLCLIEEICSTVPGLEEGKEYVLEYCYGPELKPITFKFREGFRKRIEVSKNLAEPRTDPYGE